jgi:hypothetical protein
MASNEIKIIVGGDAGGLQKTATQSTAALNSLQKSVSSTNAALVKSKTGTNEATFALTNLSRVAQDAPFGFIGIANNINPLLESFQRLKQQTGTAQGAIKALIGSLAGAGGLGLAVGIGSAALTLLGQGFFSGGRAAKKAADEVSDFKKILEEVSSDMARDASRVTTLFSALTSGTLNLDERKKALEELKSINKEFFGSLKEEEGLVKNLQSAYDQYLENLLDIGRAKAIESQLTKLFDKKLQLELSIDPKFIGSTTAGVQSAIGRLRKELQSLGGELTADELKREVNFFDQGNKSLQRRVQLQQQITQLEQGVGVIRDSGSRAIINQVKQIDLQIAGLSQLQKDTGEFQIKTDKHNAKEKDALKERLDALEKIKKVTEEAAKTKLQFGAQQSVEQATQDLIELEKRIGELKLQIGIRDAKGAKVPQNEIDELAKAIKADTEKNVNDLLKAQKIILQIRSELRVGLVPIPSGEIESAIAKATGFDKKIPIKSDRQVRIEILGLELVLAEEEAKKAVERLRDTIVNGAADAFSTVGNSFGELLSGAFSGAGIGEAFSKAGQSLLSGIGGVLQEIGKQIIATSTLIKALKESLKTLIANPIGGILVGVGLVALGGLLKNIKFPAFAGGVNNFSGGFAWVGEKGPELVRLPRGSDVIPNHMLGTGGNTNVILMPSIRFSLTSFQIGLERVESKRRRLG